MASVYLTAFDEALHAIGGTRIAGGEFKSQARLIGSPGARSSVSETWHCGIVSATCRVASPADGPSGKVLGIDLDGETLGEQLRAATAHIDSIQKAILGIADAPAELALLRTSANVCRIVHLLRAAGPDLDVDALHVFDDAQDDTLGSLLGGALPSSCAERAACGVGEGGLGLRRARDLQFPAFLASRAEAQGLAEEFAQTLPHEIQERLFIHWSHTTDAALEQWQRELTPATAAVALQALEEASTAADARCARFVGRLPASFDSEAGDALAKRVACALVSPAGLEDPEHPDAPGRQLQRRLVDLAAHERMNHLRCRLVASGDWAGTRLLDDLQHPGTDHSWMWVLAASDAAVVHSADFADALLLRLGAPLIREVVPCARCGQDLDLECRHALRCAPGPATRGHNRIRDTLLGLASLSDGAAASEVAGLVASAPASRPADVLTRAAFGRLSALDVVIASPDAQGAGDDAADAAVRRKLNERSAILGEMSDEGIEYRPVAWTCWGRPHADAQAAVHSMSLAAARRRGDVDARDIERRARGAVGVQIWRRAAQMVSACLPRAHPDPARVLPGAIAAAQARMGRSRTVGDHCSEAGYSCSSLPSTPRASSRLASCAPAPSPPGHLCSPQAGGAEFGAQVVRSRAGTGSGPGCIGTAAVAVAGARGSTAAAFVDAREQQPGAPISALDAVTDVAGVVGAAQAAAAASAGAACEAFAAASGAACSSGSGSRASGQPCIVEKSGAWQLGAG